MVIPYAYSLFTFKLKNLSKDFPEIYQQSVPIFLNPKKGELQGNNCYT